MAEFNAYPDVTRHYESLIQGDHPKHDRLLPTADSGFERGQLLMAQPEFWLGMQKTTGLGAA